MPKVGETTRSESKRTLKERLGYDPNAEHALVIATRIRFPAEDPRNAGKATMDIEDELLVNLGVNYIVKTSASYRSADGKLLSTYDVEVGRHKEKRGKSLLQRVLNTDEDYPLVINLDINFPATDDRLAADAADDISDYLLEQLRVEEVVFINAWYRTDDELISARDYETRRYGEENVRELPKGL